jgi:uncharacterized protein YggE
MRTTVFCFLAIVTLSVVAGAQQPADREIRANTIYVSADGEFSAPADMALVRFNIGAQESSSRAAYDRASRAAEQVRGVLRSNGIDPKEAHIGFFTLQPVYDWRTPQRKLAGYRVSTAVELKLKDLSVVGPIVEQLANIDVTANQSLSYTLQSPDEAKVKAVEDALRRAHLEAHALAAAGGRTLGEMSSASIDSIEQPRPFRAAQPAMARASGTQEPPPTEEFTPQSVTVTARVSVVFALK